tara:strand:- start:167 stop:580 length:414 start_codon:yes stop_codon:yes gene_type:complete
METCKARVCKKTKKFNNILEGWNDFKRCNKKCYKDGFCEYHYKIDTRSHAGWGWETWCKGEPVGLWKKDGIYGEPYDFPYHKTESEREWVEKIYILHPEIRPPISPEEKLEKVKQWFENNSEKINYKIGKELNDILQ